MYCIKTVKECKICFYPYLVVLDGHLDTWEGIKSQFTLNGYLSGLTNTLTFGTYGSVQLGGKVFDLASNIPNYTAADYQYGAGYVLEKTVEIYLFKKLGNAFKTTTQSFQSFSAFKRAMGPAGQGRAWHHIVEQNPVNRARFAPEALHNSKNVINVPAGQGSIHARVTGYYNSLIQGTSMRVRDYVNTLTYQQQYQYGIEVLKRFGWKP